MSTVKMQWKRKERSRSASRANAVKAQSFVTGTLYTIQIGTNVNNSSAHPYMEPYFVTHMIRIFLSVEAYSHFKICVFYWD
jgi:hypothetical protein